MKFNVTFAGQPSGSLGAMTASHNRGGYYLRHKSIPVDPSTSLQNAVRDAFSTISWRWFNVLTALERTAWDAYAAVVLMPDALGVPTNIGGRGHYIRSNVPRLQADPTGLVLPIVDTAPSNQTLGEFTLRPSTYDESAGTLSQVYANTDEWAGAEGGALLVYQGVPRNASVNFYKGPFRFVGIVEGDGTPPTSPAVFSTLPFPVFEGQAVFTQLRATLADGRLSNAFRNRSLVVP